MAHVSVNRACGAAYGNGTAGDAGRETWSAWTLGSAAGRGGPSSEPVPSCIEKRAHQTARGTRFVNAYILSMDSCFFEGQILNSLYAYPARHWELGARDSPPGTSSRRVGRPSSSRPSPGPRNTREARGRSAWCPPPCGPVARHQQPERVGRDAGSRAAASTLATPRVHRRPPLLLSDRGGGDRDLAHRGGAEREVPELMRLAFKLATGAGKTMVARAGGTPPAFFA